MLTLSCAVVGTSGINVISVDIPSHSSVREVAVIVKQHCPRELRDISTAKISLYLTSEQGKYIPSSSIELGLLPEFLEAGEYKYARESILDAWIELKKLDEILEDVLPPSTTCHSPDTVQLVALIPPKKVTLMFGREIFRISINESALVGELKNEAKNMKSEMIKLVEAKVGNRCLHRDDVKGRPSQQMTDFLRAITAQDEINLSRTIISVFGDGRGDTIDAVVVPSETIAGQYQLSSMREERSTSKPQQKNPQKMKRRMVRRV